MAQQDKDLFDRLRGAGLRKQVAKTLSELSGDASKKATRAARGTIGELRSLADEIEKRLPSSVRPASARRRSSSGTTARRASSSGAGTRRASSAATSRKPSSSTASRSRTATPRASRSSAATASRTRRAPASASKSAPARKPASAPTAAGARAPRGANKAKILRSLRSGPKTASEIAKETGIGAGTVGSTLSKMAISGEVRKAERGYGLPS